MPFQETLPTIGDNGQYQYLILWLVFLPANLPFGTHNYCQLLMSWTPDHWCNVPGVQDGELYLGFRLAMVREYKNLEFLHSQCFINRSINDNVMVEFSGKGVVLEGANVTHSRTLTSSSCEQGWYFNRSWLQDDNTVVTEWDLVCDRGWLPTFALTLFGLGEFFSLPLYFYITYRHGRRFSFFLFLTTQCLFGALTAFSPNIACFSILRFLVGLTVPASVASPSALAQELVGQKLRGQTLLLSYLFRSLGAVLLSGSVFVIRDWPQIAMAATLPFAAFFLFWWVFPESPRWLLARGRFEETIRLIRTIAQVNKRHLNPDYIVSTKRRFQLERSLRGQEENPQTELEATKDLFRPAALRKRTLVLIFSWLTSTASFLGLNYFCLELHGDIYLNFLLSAVTEMLGWIVAALILRCCSRRCSYCVTCALGGVLCITMATRRRGKSASLTLFVSTKLSISISYFVLPVWTAELLPTSMRDTGLALADIVSLTCPVFLPLLIYQGRNIQSLPMTLIGVLQVLGGLVALGLPETRLINFLNPPVVQGIQCDNPWSCRNCAHYQMPKIDPVNGILRNRGPIPQSPIFSLLRGQLTQTPLSGRDSDPSENVGRGLLPMNRQPSMDELKVTVL